MTFREAQVLLDAPLPTPADLAAACTILGEGQHQTYASNSRVVALAAAIARARAEGRLEVCRAGGGYPDSDPMSWAAAVLREREALDEAHGRIASLEAALVECSRIGTRAMAEVEELTRALDVIRADCEQAGIPGEVDVPDPGSDDPAQIREWRSTPGLVTIALAQRAAAQEAESAEARSVDQRVREAHAAGLTEGRLAALAEVVADAVSEDGRTYEDGRESMRRDILALDRWSAVGVEAIRSIEPAMGSAPAGRSYEDGVRVGREEAAAEIARSALSRIRALPAPSEPAPTLTNCDSCWHDYGNSAGRMCDRMHTGDAEQDEAVAEWIADDDNVDEKGSPLPGATGCPGYAPKPAPTTPKEGE